MNWHNVGYSNSSEQYCKTINGMCHANHFTVLQTVDIDSNECASPVVEEASDTDR